MLSPGKSIGTDWLLFPIDGWTIETGGQLKLLQCIQWVLPIDDQSRTFIVLGQFD